MDESINLELTAAQSELIIEEAPEGSPFVLMYRGVASIDNVISRNGVYYSREANDAMLESTKAYIADGEVVTIFSRHGKAVQKDKLAEGLPVGHVVDLYRDGDKIKYIGGIVGTSEGNDVAKLIRAKTYRASSIRLGLEELEVANVRIGNRRYRSLVKGRLRGIDLADESGIKGAGIEEILEEAPEIKLEASGGTEMDWENVTIDMIRENRADLLEEFTASVLEANPPDPEGELAALTEERDTLKTRLDELTESSTGAIEVAESKVAELELEVALLESSQIGAGKEIYAALKEKVAKIEEIEAILEEVRSEALNKYMVSRKQPSGEIKPKGKSSQEEPPMEESPKKVSEKDLSAEQKRALELAGFSIKSE